MATSYSANQYDSAFVPKRLQSWQTPKSSSARPKSTNGTTKPIATTDGRVLFQYNRENSFKTNYINTWDLPKRLPGSNIDNATARDIHAYEKLKQDFSESKLQLTGQKFNYKPVISYGKKQKATKNTREVTSSQANENPSDSFSDCDGGTPGLDGARFTPGSQGEADTGRSENVGEDQPKISNKIPLPDFSREFQRDEERREVTLAAL